MFTVLVSETILTISLHPALEYYREKLLSKVDSADVKRSVNALRGKANEIAASAGKYGKAPAAIDFGAYKKKLKFTAGAVDALEKTYKSKSLPEYSASLPSFEAKKRAALLSVVKSTVAAAKADLDSLNAQLSAFEDGRITTSTSVGELRSRFPTIAKEIETEIKEHQWAKDSL